MTDASLYQSGSFTSIAKITWEDPTSHERHEFVLTEGSTASIGRSPQNDISIPERHVSRQHAVISYRDGVFVISDLGSANGTFVNDQRLTSPYPLVHKDTIRLYVPILNFYAAVSEDEVAVARTSGQIKIQGLAIAHPKLVATSGTHEGTEFNLTKDMITVGRATQDTTWDISLQDRAVSRPHCRFSKKSDGWTVMDLGSANGTMLNGSAVTADPRVLKDGDVLLLGETTLLFRLSG